MTKLMRVNEVAEMLDLPEDRVYALSREGIIPTVRCGRQLRWSLAQIQDFITSGGKGYSGGWKKEA